MAAPQNAPLPPFFSLDSGMTIRLTALDPTSGAVVAGVEVSGASIDVARDDGTAEPAPSPVSGAYTSGSLAA